MNLCVWRIAQTTSSFLVYVTIEVRPSKIEIHWCRFVAAAVEIKIKYCIFPKLYLKSAMSSSFGFKKALTHSLLLWIKFMVICKRLQLSMVLFLIENTFDFTASFCSSISNLLDEKTYFILFFLVEYFLFQSVT